MARLTKAETYAIKWLSSQGKNVDQIAEELKLTEQQVKRTIEKSHASSKTKNNVKTATEKANNSKAKDLIITKTAGKNINSVAIMTKEASEVSDAHRQSSNNVATSRAFKNSIYRPRQ